MNALANKLWYPVWDCGLDLDQSVRTRAQCEAVTDHDLPAAMGWLDVVPVAGDTELIRSTALSILERWRKAARKRLPELLDSAKARLDEFGRMEYLNQPDIKEARGGLRDSVLVSALAASWLADRPHGRYDDAVERLLDVRDCIHLVAGKDANRLLSPYQAKVAAMNDGDVVLLENVRFNPEETSKDPEERAAYAKKIAALGEAFVSDGFGVVHRAQGSNYDVAADLPAAAGLLVEKEVKALSRATENPERPLTVVLGGSKVSDKLGVIDNLLDKANRLVIGGGMAYTFLKAKGLEVGTSLLEEDQVETVKGYIERAEQNGVELVLPTDIVVNPVFPKSDEDIAPEVVAADAIPADKMGLDIGPDSQKLFHDKIVDSKTVVWNGPMGVFEVPEFAAGTKAVAQGLVDATAAGAFTIVGGGDSASAVRNLGFPEDGFSHISTGGGASLEFLEGKELPGLKVLD